ncbi:hypothetical protein CQW23_02700 [Capsicum baccatum]|uniref:Uncharacterized protein n=1 Tax=Capsicum baccatum TaxID=33114 RepID=A0A2G2XS61_CAPBA|nr:hypothetical protein CQW23_02700 [Capsicum baccatum]
MCPEILTIPLSTTLRPAVTFLLREVNVAGEKLPGVLRRRPHLLTKCVEKNLRPTLYFLQGSIGIEDVSKCASLLSCDVEGKFIPRLDYFQRIGFARRDAKVMFRRFPSLFCYSIEENLEPKFDYFVVEMGRELKELIEFPQYFSFSLENRIKPRHKMCVEKGVCLSLPVMLKSCESRFRDRLDVCCSSSMPNLVNFVLVLFNYFVVEMGTELKALIVFPQYFSFSLENRIKPRHKMCVEKGVCLSLPVVLKSCESRFRDWLDVCCSSSMPNLVNFVLVLFNYFVVEMGTELKALIVFPQYFSFSLENRIKPRHKMCVEKGVCLSLPVVLKSCESRFRDWLDVCCSSSMPNLVNFVLVLFNYFVVEMGTELKALIVFPQYFSFSLENRIKPRHKMCVEKVLFNYFVVEMGTELKELIVFPQYFSFGLENRIKPRHKMCVEKGLCLSLPVMLKSCESRFLDRLDVCCSSSMPSHLELKFNYFVVEMGRELKELIVFPQYFSFSLENRIKPRHKMCVEKRSSMPVRQSPFWYRKFDHNYSLYTFELIWGVEGTDCVPHYFSFSLENRIKPRHKLCVEKDVCLSLPVMLKSHETRFGDRLESGLFTSSLNGELKKLVVFPQLACEGTACLLASVSEVDVVVHVEASKIEMHDIP